MKNLIVKLTSLSFKFNKYKFILLFFLITLNSFLELLSVGIFIPFASFIFKEDDFFGKSFFNDFDESIRLIIFLSIILLIFLLKFIFFVYVIYFKNKYLLKFNLKLSDIVLKNLINKPLKFHLENQSSSNINIVQQVDGIIDNISVLIFIFLDFFTLIFLCIFLLIYEPYATSAIFFILFSFSYIYYIFSKKKNVCFRSNKI